jgi:hypothetical protein
MKVIVLTVLISITAQAGSGGLARKKEAVISAIVNRESALTYRRQMANYSASEKIIVSVQDFKEILASQTPYQRAIQKNTEPEIIARINQFVTSNDLNTDMVSITYLQSAQNSLMNIIFLVGIQKLIAERPDLEIFGAETIKNLNTAITERIVGLYMMAEQFLKGIRLNSNVVLRMKRNFVEFGLDYQNFLDPSERWLSEYLGLDPINVKKQNPRLILSTLTDISTKKINRALRRSVGICANLFSGT